jgi:hypothetical protein
MNNYIAYGIATVTVLQELVPRYIIIPSCRPQHEPLTVYQVMFATLKHYRNLNRVYPLIFKRYRNILLLW